MCSTTRVSGARARGGMSPVKQRGGELVGHDANAPALLVAAALAVAVGEDLVRRVALAALAERAGAAGTGDRLVLGRDGPLGAVGGDDDPAAHDRVLAQFRHRQT